MKDDRGVARVLATLLLVLATAGVALHRDYGLPWDEPIQRAYARLVLRHVTRGDARLLTDPNRVYGPAHELALLGAEAVAGARDAPDVFAARHLANFAVFGLGVVFFYRLAARGFGSPASGLLAAGALVLSPPIFAHAFFNSKDIPFLAFFVISAWTLLRFLEDPRPATALRHALACGWLIAIRVVGVLVPLLTVIGIAHVAIASAPAGPGRRRLGAHGALYLGATAAVAWTLWPTLWRDPWSSFIGALETMSRFPWDQKVLYRGALVPATALPWHYAPVWIAITTPLVYLAGVPAGLAVLIARSRHPASGPRFFPVLVLLWLGLPLAAVVLLGSVLYDGWRHLYFIYPALLLVSLAGYRAMYAWLRSRLPERAQRPLVAAAGLALALAASDIVRFMAAAHPHQHVFFNALVGGVRGARFRYELDYWGLSYRRGLEELLARDPDPVLGVHAADPIGAWTVDALAWNDRRRLVRIDDPEQAEYFLGAYRLRQDEYPYPDVLYQVLVDGTPILSVARAHREKALTPETAPALVAALARNAAAAAGTADAALAQRVSAGLHLWVARFVRHARVLAVDVEPAAAAMTRQGRMPRVRIRVEGGELGDFRYDKPGIPIRSLDVTLEQVVVDLERLDRGELVPVRLGGVSVDDLSLDAEDVNQALAKMPGHPRRVRVGFEGGAVRVHWLGRPSAELRVRAWVGPDSWKQGSENLFFEVTNVRVAGWPVPAAAALRFLAGRFSPVARPDQPGERLSLGTLRLEDGRLALGLHAGPGPVTVSPRPTQR